MKIIYNDYNFKDSTCQRFNTDNKICSINGNELKRIISPFKELTKNESSLDDLKLASETAKKKEIERERIRVKVMKEENAGYVLTGVITTISIISVIVILFFTIGFLIGR